MTFIGWLTELITRAKTESPDFFIKTRKWAIIIGVLVLALDTLTNGSVIHSIFTDLNGFHLFTLGKIQSVFDTCANTILTIITTVTGVSFLPVKEKLKETQDGL